MAKQSVINRNTLKGLRSIMEEDYTFVLQSFLDDSLVIHGGLHQAWENSDHDLFHQQLQHLIEAANSVGADSLVALLAETQTQPLADFNENQDATLQAIDELFNHCHEEIQKELKKARKIAV